MGSVGAPELIVIFLVALIVLGPDRLPKAARQVGRAISEFKRVTGGFQDEVRKALDVDGEAATAESAPPPTASPAPPEETYARPVTGAARPDIDLPPPPDDPSRN